MLPESELIPYGSSELPPGPWLVFSPHPDDETFGLGGSRFLQVSKISRPMWFLLLTEHWAVRLIRDRW